MEGKLEEMIGKEVSVITTDGRNFVYFIVKQKFKVGILKSFDQAMNIVLSECKERIYSKTDPVMNDALGAYIIRGDHVCVIGEVDHEMDSKIDYTKIRADPINPIPHST